MVMPAGNIAFSPEFEKIKAELQDARNHYIALEDNWEWLKRCQPQLVDQYRRKI